MSTEDKLPSLASLEAYIESLKGDSLSALRKLEGFTDPDAIRRRLAILIDTNQYENAVKSITDIASHSSWVDLAIFAHAGIGDIANAKQRLVWTLSQNDQLLSQKVCLKFIAGCMHWAFREKKNGEHLSPGSLSPTETHFFQT